MINNCWYKVYTKCRALPILSSDCRSSNYNHTTWRRMMEARLQCLAKSY